MQWFARVLRHHWGELVLAGILALIITLNIRPGYVLLGNDNFSPELDPQLTFSRSLYSPAWRTYRVQGIPSDSEQADIVRSGVYTLLRPVFPAWVLSQGYMFLAFFIGSFSMAHLVKTVLAARHQKHLQLALLFGGLAYLCSMLTIWIFFFPVHLFVAAYAFLPFILWRIAVYVRHVSVPNGVWVLLSSLAFAPAALTATMYLVCALMMVSITAWSLLTLKRTWKKRIMIAISTVVLVFGVHAFWFIPFISYVRTQVGPLQSSAINRDITTTTIENERKHNTALNSVRYFAAWMDTKEEGDRYTFPQRDWYSETSAGLILSLIPLALAGIGLLVAGKKHWYDMFLLAAVAVAGWFFIKGANPPLGSIFSFLQQSFPVVAQVFRWQSSKLWPLLGVVIPIFVGVGVVGLAHVFQRRIKIVGIGIFMIIAGALLVYIHPFFQGQLIRTSMYQKLPAEYTSLAAYLYKNDPHGRIYPAPEANTLYFRNYSWGFWGSVVLNYLLPNPVMEKALVIGSAENEQAYTVVMNAYYSRDPARFARALRRYDVAYVLSDRNADSQQRGYTYDWELHTKSVDANPELEKVWGEGKLALYRVKPSGTTSIMPVYSGHDWTKLALTATLNPDNFSYATAETGSIFPFALSDMSWTPYAHAVQGLTTYTGAPGTFLLAYNQAIAGSVPTQISVRGTEVVFTPAVPTLRINDALYGQAKGRFSGVLPANTAFLTLDRDVVPLVVAQATPLVYSQSAGLLMGNTVQTWSGTATEQDLVRGDFRLHCPEDAYISQIPLSSDAPVTCATGPIPVNTSTVAEVRGTLTLPENSKVTLCILSELERRCLNPNVTAMGDGQTKSFRMVLPQSIQLGDSIKLYLTGELTGGLTGVLAVSDITLSLYQSALALPLVQQEALELPGQSVTLETGDSIGLSVPLLRGGTSWRYQSDDMFIPETAITAFDTGKGFGSVLRESEERLTASIREGTLSTYPKWERVQSEGIAMFTYSAKNSSGIPMEISMRELKAGNKLFQRRIASDTTTTETALVLVPAELRSYQLEVLHTGIGPQISQNTLTHWSVQMLPLAWTRLALTPVITDSYTKLHPLQPISLAQNSSFHGNVPDASGAVVTIPTAVSPYWRISPSAMSSVLVNGWQQAWTVPQDGAYAVDYLGNYQAWVGGIAGVTSVVAVLFWVWKWGSRWISRAE